MKAVMSIGNPIKSDDNIGNIVLDQLKADKIIKIRAETAPENFLTKLEDCEEIIILDALQFGGKVGEVKRFELDEVEDRLLSTHSIPLDMLKRLFPNTTICIIGIQPKIVEFGEELSIDIQNEMENILENVKSLI